MTQVKVLQHHIDQGVPRSTYSCAIALALREQFPDTVYVQVGGATLTVVLPDRVLYAKTPLSAAQFIASFDVCSAAAHSLLKPFVFDAEFRRSR